MAESFEMTLPAISKYIRVLENASLVDRGKDAQFWPCTLNPRPLAEVADWTDQYQHILDGRFEMLAYALERLTEADHG